MQGPGAFAPGPLLLRCAHQPPSSAKAPPATAAPTKPAHVGATLGVTQLFDIDTVVFRPAERQSPFRSVFCRLQQFASGFLLGFLFLVPQVFGCHYSQHYEPLQRRRDGRIGYNTQSRRLKHSVPVAPKQPRSIANEPSYEVGPKSGTERQYSNMSSDATGRAQKADIGSEQPYQHLYHINIVSCSSLMLRLRGVYGHGLLYGVHCIAVE